MVIYNDQASVTSRCVASKEFQWRPENVIYVGAA